MLMFDVRRLVVCLRATLCLAAFGLLAACSDSSTPPVAIEGGGFVFNTRIAEVFYGISVKPLRRLPVGTELEATFENPAGGAPIVVRQTMTGDRLAYALRTPAVSGVRKDRDYRVTLTVRAAGGGEVLGRVEKVLRSDLDQDMMPDKPLTVGPGYTPNPDAKAN